MRRVAGQISYRAVRNHGTIGGSVALADPAADWPCCLMALDASVRIVGRNGVRVRKRSRTSSAGPTTRRSTAGDIIMGFDVPRPAAPLRWGFAKVARKSGAFANSIAIVTVQGRDGPVSVVLGAAGPRAMPAAQRRQTALRQPRARTMSCAPPSPPTSTLHVPDADPYQKRMHTATILRAIRDMQAQ